MNRSIHANKGISLIEVLIAFAVTSILLAATLPAHQDHAVRGRVSAGLSHAFSATEALQKTCASNSLAVISDKPGAGHSLFSAATQQGFVERISVQADCANQSMVVVIWTANTGAPVDPVIELSAQELTEEGTEEFVGRYHWACRLVRGDASHLPVECLDNQAAS